MSAERGIFTIDVVRKNGGEIREKRKERKEKEKRKKKKEKEKEEKRIR